MVQGESLPRVGLAAAVTAVLTAAIGDAMPSFRFSRMAFFAITRNIYRVFALGDTLSGEQSACHNSVLSPYERTPQVLGNSLHQRRGYLAYSGVTGSRMVSRSFAHLHPLSSHPTGRTLTLRLDHLPCQRTLQAERAPRWVRWEVQDQQPAEISWCR